MANLYITEFATQGRDSAGKLLENGTPQEPPLAEQVVAITAASVQSAVFNPKTTLIRVATDAVCSVAINANPVASATSRRLAAGQTEQFAVAAGSAYRMAVITNV